MGVNCWIIWSILLYAYLSLSQTTILFTNIQPATSLGGVESLIEYKHETDPSADSRLVRLSIGLEEIDVRRDDIYLEFCDENNIGLESWFAASLSEVGRREYLDPHPSSILHPGVG